MLWYVMVHSVDDAFCSLLLWPFLSECCSFVFLIGVFAAAAADATAHFFSVRFFFFFYFVDAHYNFTAIVFPRCKLIHLAYGHTYTYVYRHRQSV